MRVARLYGTGDIRVGDEPEPAGTASGHQHEDDEALVRVTAVGICGSDLHWWTEGAIGDAKLSRPLVLGHEGAGVIAAGPRIPTAVTRTRASSSAGRSEDPAGSGSSPTLMSDRKSVV